MKAPSTEQKTNLNEDTKYWTETQPKWRQDTK